MPRVAITILTFAALTVAMVLGVSWFALSEPGQRWEPAVNTLALLAGITGIFAERWAAQRERRQQAIESVEVELAKTQEVLDGPEFTGSAEAGRRLYPRLVHSAVDAAIASGVLNPRRDDDLIDLLHGWRGAAASLNQRLQMTEMLMFTTASADEVGQLRRALHEAPFMVDVRQRLVEARAYLGAMRSEPSKRITSPLR